jgi:TetR/AcrR family transcriptional repressor of nem operon
MPLDARAIRPYRSAILKPQQDSRLAASTTASATKPVFFNAAFAHYNRTVLQHRLSHHAPAEASLQGLRELFLSLLKEPNDESYGCLITNSAVELGSEDGPHTGVGEGMRILAAAFAERLDAARGAGFLRGTSDPREGALKLLALYQGILVLVRAGCDKAGLERLILNEFDNLEISHDT